MMDFGQLLSDEFNPWEVPLTTEYVREFTRIQDQLDEYRQRIDKRVSLIHRSRLEARKEAGLPSPWSYHPSGDSRAGCSFKEYARDGSIIYSGSVWFRGECESFSHLDCEPIPADWLSASEEEILERCRQDAAIQHQALDEKRREADAIADQAKVAHERAELERLRLKYG